MAQALLARTLGHAVGARTGILRFLSNLLFPASLLLYSHLLADSVLTLGFASKALVGVVAATLAAKAAVEGWSTVPKYCPERGRRTLFFFAAAFAFFPLPELFPRKLTAWRLRCWADAGLMLGVAALLAAAAAALPCLLLMCPPPLRCCVCCSSYPPPCRPVLGVPLPLAHLPRRGLLAAD